MDAKRPTTIFLLLTLWQAGLAAVRMGICNSDRSDMNVMVKKSLACRCWLWVRLSCDSCSWLERDGHGLWEEVEQVSKLYRSTVLSFMLAKAKFCGFFFFLIGLISFVGLVTDMVCQLVPSLAAATPQHWGTNMLEISTTSHLGFLQ